MSEKSEKRGRPDHIDKIVSLRIKTRRMMLGVSQQELADSVGVSVQQMQKYENAKNRVASGKLFTLSQILKVPIEYFFKPEKDEAVTVFAEEGAEYDASAGITIKEKEIVSLVSSFRKIQNPEIRQKIVELVELFAAA